MCKQTELTALIYGFSTAAFVCGFCERSAFTLFAGPGLLENGSIVPPVILQDVEIENQYELL